MIVRICDKCDHRWDFEGVELPEDWEIGEFDDEICPRCVLEKNMLEAEILSEDEAAEFARHIIQETDKISSVNVPKRRKKKVNV